MSILDRLSQEVPKRRQAGEHNPQYQATLQFMDEIEQAKKQGYTWWQISAAVKEELTAQGLWRDSWRSCDIPKFYAQAKKTKAA